MDLTFSFVSPPILSLKITMVTGKRNEVECVTVERPNSHKTML